MGDWVLAEHELTFEYVLAIQGDSEHALATGVDRTRAVPAQTYLLLPLAEDIVLPVTDLAADADPCADSFALDEVGGVLLAALEEWTRECVPSAIWAARTPSSGSPRTSCGGRARASSTP
ncbi:hypothetical protein ACWDBW_46995 [Streptomyces sp. NPDC001107]